MKYHIRALYTISIDMVVEANSREEALEIAESETDDCIHTEWNGNSVFADPTGSIEEITLTADGMARDFICEEED
jgi:hypothetical protein